MNALRERLVRQRARFIEDYDDYVDQARLDLGKLFRIDDHPSKEALQGKFAIRDRITPTPTATATATITPTARSCAAGSRPIAT